MSEGPSKLISVITPVYNGEQFLRQALACLEAQTEQDFEWILVDDGSTDSSWETIRTIEAEAELNVRGIKLDANAGAAAARNAGIRIAEGRFLKFYDADDFLEPDHLRIQSGVALERSAAVVASPTHFLFDVDGRETIARDRLFDTAFATDNDLAHYIVKPGFVHCGCLFSRRLVDELGGYDESLLTDEDGWLLIQCFASGAKIVPAAETYYTYKVWYQATGINLSSNTSAAKLASRMEVCRRLRHMAERSGDLQLKRAVATRMAVAALESGHIDYGLARGLMAEAHTLNRDFSNSAYPLTLRLTTALGFRLALAGFQRFKTLRRFKYYLTSRLKHSRGR